MTTRDAEFHTELFGENTYIFSPEDDPGQVAQTLDAIYEKQEADQFGEARYAIYFMPGDDRGGCWVLYTGGRAWRTSD